MAKDGQRAALLGDVERMVELLAGPLPPPPTVVAKITEWWTGKRNPRRQWRRVGIATFEGLRQQLLRGEAAIDERTTEVLVFWMSSFRSEFRYEIDATAFGHSIDYLEAETDEIRSLASSIQRRVGELTER